MIYIVNKKTKVDNIIRDHPQAKIFDVTSKGPMPWRKFSPFFPHGNIPIPLESNGETAESVEGIWQGLKVFSKIGIDRSSFKNISMKNIKRTVRKFGMPLGHQSGTQGYELLDYLTARKKIYLRAYAYVLDNYLVNEIANLELIAQQHDLILLDYDTNENIEDISKPLSHASLIKKYLIKRNPNICEDIPQLKNNRTSNKIERQHNKKLILDVKKSEVKTFENRKVISSVLLKNHGINTNSKILKGIYKVRIGRYNFYDVEDLKKILNT